jgi:hypothetical protein
MMNGNIDEAIDNAELIDCPYDKGALGQMVAEDLYKHSEVAYRELVSNGFDAMRNIPDADKKMWIYPNVAGDAVGIDNGTGIVDKDRFVHIGRTHENHDTDDINKKDNREIARFGLGKNSYLALSKTRTAVFYSRSSTVGMILKLVQGSDKIIRYSEPKYLNGDRVLPHKGLKVVIKDIKKPFSTQKMIDKLSKWFALKIARGYKLYVDDIQVQKPDNFDSRQYPLFRLDNGCEVYGNLKAVEKPRQENIDIFIDQVNIEAKDYPRKVEGWLDCDELELTNARDAVRTDENTAWPDFDKKFREYLEANFDPIEPATPKNTHSQQWEKIASQAIVKYFQQNPDDEKPVLEGIATKLGLEGLQGNKAQLAKKVWKTLENKKLKRTDELLENCEKRTLRNKRKEKPGTKIKKKKQKPKKKNQKYRYDLVPGQGLVEQKQDDNRGSPEGGIVEPKLTFQGVPKGRDQPFVEVDFVEGAISVNYSWINSAKMFANKNDTGARNEICRAVVKAARVKTPVSEEEMEKKYWNLVEAMSEK